MDAIEKAFNAATTLLEISGLHVAAENEISLANLDRALKELEMLKPLAKPQLLKACAASVLQDQKILPVEVELLRAFSHVLGCPMPPVIL